MKVCSRDGCEAPVKSRESKSKYCSSSCAATVNNAAFPKRSPRGRKPCPYCGTEPNKSHQEYCSVQCRRDHDLSLYLQGHLDGCTRYGYAYYVRRYLEERSGFRCEAVDSRTGERCTEDRQSPSGDAVLQVDHIDGDWRNNRPDNVRLICPTCHALTENWGARNMGNGRKWKAEYSQF